MFLGFANFYRKFIKNDSNLFLPLIQLKQKNGLFIWKAYAKKAFTDLKCAFTSTLVLTHVDLEKKFIIKVDVSDFAFSSVLSQLGEDGKLHLIAFHSWKFTAVEINYDIHNKKLLAIVDSFEQWRQFWEGFPHQVIVYYDHKNLTYFQTARVLNREQAH